MGCQGEVELGSNLTFSICCHDPDTGVLTDADSLPSYRIYENETATPILTGTMAKLDDGNTTGFYTELVACTTGNGFSAEKSYTIYIEATVDSDKGGIAFSFRVKSEFDTVIEGTLTFKQILKLLLSVLAGKSSGGGTTSLSFRDNADTKNRVSATVDSNGNRTVVTLDGD